MSPGTAAPSPAPAPAAPPLFRPVWLNPKPLSLKLHVTVTDFSKSLSTAAIAGNGACVTLGHSAFVTASDLSVLAAFAICIKSVTGAGITCTCPAARPACRCCMMCRNCKTTAAHEGRLSKETLGAGRELYDAIRTRAAHSTDRQIECVPSNHSTQHVASHSWQLHASPSRDLKAMKASFSKLNTIEPSRRSLTDDDASLSGCTCFTVCNTQLNN